MSLGCRYTKAVFEEKMNTIVSLVIDGIAEGTSKQRRARAWAILGILTGGLHLCRALPDSTTVEQVARSIVKTAEEVAGPTRG